MSLLSRFFAHVSASGLVMPGDVVLVAYSGGADSTCLLTLLHEAATELRIEVVAAHLHHGQRPEADGEAARCQGYCDAIGVPLMQGKADVPAMARLQRTGLEEAGRAARYAFLARAARGCGATKVATAHTLDDHVETVLANLVRGAGLAGLAGIPERRDELVRPLLVFRRNETREFCATRGLWFHDDPANSDASHLRARVRHTLIPLLNELDPRFFAATARLAEVSGEEDAFLDRAAAGVLEQAEVPLNGALRFLTLADEACFAAGTLALAPPVLLRRAVRLAAEHVGGSLDHPQTLLVCAGVTSGGNGSVTTEGGRAVVKWDGQGLHVQSAEVVRAFRHPLVVPGVTESEVFGYRLLAREDDGSEVGPTGLDSRLDAGALKGPLHLRSFEPGDRMTPLGMKGTKKLADLLREKGLTSLARARLPIICDMAGPVWAPGCAVADRAKVTDQTTRVLALGLEPIGP